MTLSKAEREALRMTFGGKCAYCGCELPLKGWHADHVEPVYRKTKRVETPDGPFSFKLVATSEVWHPERDSFENLFPCCSPCNIHKGAYSLETWRRELEGITGILQRGYPTYRHAVRFGQVVERPGPIVFWFEKWRAEHSPIRTQDAL
jgi:hypothetical protein